MIFVANPDTARITECMWGFWHECQIIMGTTVRLGGIYADKKGYHNSRAANIAKWPGNYSVRLADDLFGPDDKSAAHDLTFPGAQAGDYSAISVYCARLLRSGKDPLDQRGHYLREFYGQADTDLAVEGYDFHYRAEITSDISHRWHIHLSWLRRYVNQPAAFRAVLSILRGEPVAVWRQREAFVASLRPAPASRVLSYDPAKPRMTGGDVRVVQMRAGAFVDDIFGPATHAAVTRWQQQRALSADGIVGPRTWARTLVYSGPLAAGA